MFVYAFVFVTDDLAALGTIFRATFGTDFGIKDDGALRRAFLFIMLAVISINTCSHSTCVIFGQIINEHFGRPSVDARGLNTVCLIPSKRAKKLRKSKVMFMPAVPVDKESLRSALVKNVGGWR